MKSIDSEARLGWQAAEELLRPFGAVAANFSEAIRLLVHHYEVGSNRLPLSAENHIVRLLRNNTIKATYYFLTKEHRPYVLTPGKLIEAKEFFEAYTPIEHAVVNAALWNQANELWTTNLDSVREGSFERAARALHVTPSAVSQRVRLLERTALRAGTAPIWQTIIRTESPRHA
jgi:hypothetical protein